MGIVAVNLVNAWIRKQGKLSAINKARNAVKTDMPSRAGSSAKHTRTRIIVASDTVREREEVPCKRIGETMPIGNLHGRFELPTAMPRLAPAKPHKGRTYGNGSIPPSPPIPPVSKSDIAVKAYGKAVYQPNGKAREYSPWACNLYNGCPHNCKYCFNNHGVMSDTVEAASCP